MIDFLCSVLWRHLFIRFKEFVEGKTLYLPPDSRERVSNLAQQCSGWSSFFHPESLPRAVPTSPAATPRRPRRTQVWSLIPISHFFWIIDLFVKIPQNPPFQGQPSTVRQRGLFDRLNATLHLSLAFTIGSRSFNIIVSFEKSIMKIALATRPCIRICNSSLPIPSVVWQKEQHPTHLRNSQPPLPTPTFGKISTRSQVLFFFSLQSWLIFNHVALENNEFTDLLPARAGSSLQRPQIRYV